MSAYIMDHFVDRERAQALAVMSKAWVVCCPAHTRYMTLPLDYMTQILAFETYDDTNEFLASHGANMYTNPTLPVAATNASRAWKLPPQPTPVQDLVWDCKKAHAACARAVDKYRVVDLKGQVD